MSETDELIPVSGVTEIAQAVIRAAPAPDRRRAWPTYTDWLKHAQEEHPDKMPWEPADSVTWLSRAVAKNLILSTVRLINDDELHHSLLDVAVKKAQSLDDNDDGKPRPLGTVACALPGCKNLFRPQRRTARYCSTNCRKAAYQRRKRSAT